MIPRLWVDGITNIKACTGRFIGEREVGQVWEVMSFAWVWRLWGTGPIQGGLALPPLLIASRWELGSWAAYFPIFQAGHWDFFKLKTGIQFNSWYPVTRTRIWTGLSLEGAGVSTVKERLLLYFLIVYFHCKTRNDSNEALRTWRQHLRHNSP